MKKTSFLSLLAVTFMAALFFVGCQKDTTTLRARIDNFGGNSKVYMGGTNFNIPTWSLGDTIWVDYTTNTNHSYYLNNISGSGVATLSLPNNPTYCALYPFGMGSVSGTTATLSIPQVQRYYEKGGKQVVNAPMAACTLNDPAGTITFHNLGALLAINIECNILTHTSMDVWEVKVTSEDHTLPLWGTATVDISDPSAIFQCSPAASGDPYTVSLKKFNSSNTAVKLFSLNTTTNKTKTVYVYVPAVPSGTNNRYTIEVVARNGSTDLSMSRTQQSVTGGNLSRNMMANVNFPMREVVAPTGAVPDAMFTINSDGDKVFFASGNLQYQRSTGTWRIAPTQWDYIGNGGSFTNGYSGTGDNNLSINSSTYTGWIDLFGWATSGYHNSSDSYNTRYLPINWESSNVNTTDNLYGYGPSDGMTNDETLDGTNVNYDWGVYHSNPAEGDNPNGGLYYVDEDNNLQKAGPGSTWRTLTSDEWKYLLEEREVNGATGINHSWSAVKLGTKYGLLFYPDGYTGQYTSTINTISSVPARCVFLPIAGQRGTQSNAPSMANTTYGYYWTVTGTSASNARYAYSLYFNVNANSYSTKYNSQQFRYRGCAVRLVTPVI